MQYLLATAAIHVAILALAGFYASKLRHRCVDQAVQAAMDNVRQMSMYITAVLDKFDLSLRAVAGYHAGQSALGGVDPARYRAFLEDLHAAQPRLQFFRVTDARGLARYGRGIPTDDPVDYAERPYFRKLRDDPDAGLVVSGPMLGLSSHEWCMVLSRRLNEPDGTFAGVASAVLLVATLEDVFSMANVGPNGSAAIRTEDFSLVYRHPRPADFGAIVGDRSMPPGLRERMLASPGRGYCFDEEAGRGTRLFCWQEAEGFPLRVIVELSDRDYLREWRRDATRLALWAASLVLLAGFSSWRLFRATRRLGDSLRELEIRNRQEELLILQLRERSIDAEAGARAKDAFLRNMSHELRTPLNHISCGVDLVLESNLDARQQKWARAIREAADRLSDLVNRILDQVTLEAGTLRMDMKWFSPETVLREVGLMLGSRARAKGLELAVEPDGGLPRKAWGDPVRLSQALFNYVDNAIKFTERGSVTLSGRTLQADDREARVRFEVRDTGIGIAAEDQAKLFAPFTQNDDSWTRRFGGTGIGLSHTRHIVELMNGEVGVESEPGKGSTFWLTVRLPLQEPPPPAAPAPAEAGDRPSGRNAPP